MTDKAQTAVKPGVQPSLNVDRSGLLQRKCECGNAVGLAGACGGCQSQRLVGMGGVQRGVGPVLHDLVQTKLVVGAVGDRYEQEADRVAEQVMRMPDPAVQRQSLDLDPEEELEEESALRLKPLAGTITPLAQRRAVRMPDIQPGLESRLSVSKSGGTPLPQDVRSFMESRFSKDFSQVRVHTSNDSVQMNQELGAKAFTHGDHIYYGAGEAPGKDELTSHELTHVIQQANYIQRQDHTASTPDEDPSELDPEIEEQLANLFPPDVSNLDDPIYEQARERFGIPGIGVRSRSRSLDGWEPTSGSSRRQRVGLILTERRQRQWSATSVPRTIIEHIRNHPEDIDHIQNTLAIFRRSGVDSSEIDLPLVLALAGREARGGLFSQSTTSSVVSSGSDVHAEGGAGFDNLTRFLEFIPEEIRHHFSPVSSSELTLEGQSRGSRPVRLPRAYLLAGAIAQIRGAERRLETAARNVFGSSLDSSLLSSLSQDARRAWIQLAFGRPFGNPYDERNPMRDIGGNFGIITALQRLRFTAQTIGQRPDLNQILTDEFIALHFSGQRARVTSADAWILQQVLPEDLATVSSSSISPVESISSDSNREVVRPKAIESSTQDTSSSHTESDNVSVPSHILTGRKRIGRMPKIEGFSPTSSIQLSVLSDELESLWDVADKGLFFNRLRQLNAQEREDPDLNSFINGSTRLHDDDRWLAQGILLHGPEPLWPSTHPSGFDLSNRHQRAAAPSSGWSSQPVPGEIGTSVRGRPITAYFFPGQTSERALVIAGVHGTERQGIQVAEMLMEDLRTNSAPPYFNVIIVPSLFPDSRVARRREARDAADSEIPSNRNFPTVNQTLAQASHATGVARDAEGRPILPENIALISLMERFNPSRIISIHGTFRPFRAGIFVDPVMGRESQERPLAIAAARQVVRYIQSHETNSSVTEGISHRSMSRNERDSLTSDIRSRMGRGELEGRSQAALTPEEQTRLEQTAAVAGNHLFFPQQENPGWSGEVNEGVSLGNYAPARGMTVFTVEPAIDRNTADYAAGRREGDLLSEAERRIELQSYANAIRTILLGNN